MRKIIAAGACAALLSGCGSTTGSSIANLIAFNSPTAPEPVDMTRRVAKVECPSIDVLENGSVLQVGSGPGLRHQFTLGDMSRECAVVNGQIAIRVGVSGRVIAGPAGGAGSFSVPIRVGVRREADQKILVSKVYNVPAAIPAGSASGVFSFVADPLTVPYTREEANEDYMVVVGMAKR
jgi:hypothetical protein